MKICISCGRKFSSLEWMCPHCGIEPDRKEGFLSFLPMYSQGNESFSSGYFADLYRLEKDNFWFRHRTRLILASMKRYFPSIVDLLEIGCGTGIVLSMIREQRTGFSLTGSDIFIEGLRFARARVQDASFYQMDACNMPFDEEFDLILALDILEHITDDLGALLNIHKSLRPGGGIIITVPQHAWLWSLQDEKAYHKRRYKRSELAKKMEGAGFRCIRITSFMTLLLPLMVLSRISGRRLTGSGDYDPMRELKIPPLLNLVFGCICRFEEHMLNRGMSLPVGGSLLFVGKKGI